MYGERYNLLFDNLKGKEFDIEQAIDELYKINEININIDDAIKQRENYCFENIGEWYLFVCNILKEKIYYFKENDKYYIVNENKIQKIDKDVINENWINKPKEEIIKFPIIRYKYVQKKGGRYFSYYDESFEYKIGEKAVAKNQSYGLFSCSDLQSLKSSTYSYKEDKTILKVAIESFEDFTNKYAFDEVKSFKVLEELSISKEE